MRGSLRLLRRNPGFAAAVVLTLAIGVGATTAVFTLADPMLFRPLPYPESDRLVQVLARADGSTRVMHGADFLRAAATVRSFEAMAAFGTAPIGGRLAGRPESPLAYQVTSGFFDVLRIRPAIGREFLRDEYQVNAAGDAAILTFPFWQSAFGGRAGILSETLDLERPARRLRIVGVLPAGFVLPDAVNRPPDLFVPYTPGAAEAGNPNRVIWPIARLAPGATDEAAAAEMQSVLAAIELEYPAFERGRQARVRSLRDGLFGGMRTPLLMLLGATGCVLLLACVNLAHLFLARLQDRRRELGVRLALGASRGQVARLLIVEASLFAVVGGAAALVLAQWTFDLIMASTPSFDHIYRLLPARMDLRVATFAVVLVGIALAIFGAVPALKTSDLDIRGSLTNAQPSSRKRGALRGNTVLIVLQCAVAVTLLVTGTLLIRSFQALAYQRLGYDPWSARMIDVQAPLSGRDLTIADRRRIYEHLGPRVQVPLAAAGGWPGLTLPGMVSLRNAPREAPRPAAYPSSSTIAGVLDLHLSAGRFYDEGEAFTNAPVVVVDRRAADRLWPGRDPLGQEVVDGAGTARQVVGVVDTLKTQLTSDPADGVAFVPFAAEPRFMNLAVRDPGASLALADVQRAVGEIVPGALVSLRPFAPFERTLGQPRFMAALLGTLGLVAVALTIVGVFGVVNHDQARRTQEIGIRMSLGADPRRILTLVLSRALVPALAGVAIGASASLWWTPALRSLLFGLEPSDPATFAIASALVALVALVASLRPAWRASRVDPVVALRPE